MSRQRIMDKEEKEKSVTARRSQQLRVTKASLALAQVLGLLSSIYHAHDYCAIYSWSRQNSRHLNKGKSQLQNRHGRSASLVSLSTWILFKEALTCTPFRWSKRGGGSPSSSDGQNSPHVKADRKGSRCRYAESQSVTEDHFSPILTIISGLALEKASSRSTTKRQPLTANNAWNWAIQMSYLFWQPELLLLWFCDD